MVCPVADTDPRDPPAEFLLSRSRGRCRCGAVGELRLYLPPRHTGAVRHFDFCLAINRLLAG